jgi:adsorption protein B
MVAVGFLLSGIDDVFIDMYYWGRELYRKLFKRHKIRPVTQADLDAVPEKWTAVFVPAWQEEAVIEKMLTNSLKTFDYEKYDFFVGTYPNDDGTRLAAARARERDRRVQIVSCPHNGPTSKADCLNWAYQGMLLLEAQRRIRYDIVVIHDSEDIVHPLELKLFNYLIPRKDMVQLPVTPMEMPWHYWTSGTYLDEFGENHSKDLLVRERLSLMIPSAGVGTALSRRALQELAKRHKNEPFNINTLTEDYELGFRLARAHLKSIFAKFRITRNQTVIRGWRRKRKEIRPVKELVAVREFFPDRFRLAVRQKSRWVLGIALQGWKNVGWPPGFWLKYVTFRDRKALATNLLNMLGYIILGFWLYMVWTHPGQSGVSLVPYRWVWYVIIADTVLMAERWLQRFVAVKSISSTMQALLSIIRLPVGNVINFWATMVAVKQFLVAELTGKRPGWDKTSHAFPNAAQLQKYRRKLGDLLLENRLVNVSQLQHALKEQNKSKEKLGAVLTRLGYISEEDLLAVLSRQLQVQTCETDLRLIDPRLLSKLSQKFAERYLILPMRPVNGVVEVATANAADMQLRKDVERRLGVRVRFILAAESDLRFAIPRAYGRQAAPYRPVLGELLLSAGLIKGEDLQRALCLQRGTGRKLGEVLQDLGLVTPEAILHELAAQQGVVA